MKVMADAEELESQVKGELTKAAAQQLDAGLLKVCGAETGRVQSASPNFSEMKTRHRFVIELHTHEKVVTINEEYSGSITKDRAQRAAIEIAHRCVEEGYRYFERGDTWVFYPKHSIVKAVVRER